MIKWLALMTMTLDHVGFFFPDCLVSSYFREIGRIAFPMFSFLIAYHLGQGVSVSKYLMRIGIFWVLSMFIFKGMFGYESYFWQLNVLGTLWFGILGIYVSQMMMETPLSSIKSKMFQIFFLIVWSISNYFGYEAAGFLYIVIFYYALKKQHLLLIALLLALTPFLEAFYSLSIIIACLTTIVLLVIPIRKSTGHRLKWYWFYAYFPFHFAVLYIAKQWIG
jgi:hypothetical protein